MHVVPSVRARQAGAGVHHLPRQRPGGAPRGRRSRLDRVRRVSPSAPGPLGRRARLRDLSRRTRRSPRESRRVEGVRRLSRAARRGGRRGGKLRGVPCPTRRTETGRARRMPELSQGARRERRAGEGVRRLPLGEGDAGGQPRPEARGVHELPYAPRPIDGRVLLCRLPRGGAREARRSGRLRDVPRGPRPGVARRGAHVHVLSPEDRRQGRRCPRGPRRVRDLPQGARLFRGERRGRSRGVQRLSRTRDHARVDESRSLRLRELPRNERPHTDEGARLRDLPREGGGDCDARSPELCRLPRASRGRRARGCDVHQLPRARVGEQARRRREGRLFLVPPPARPRRGGTTARVCELSRAREAPCAARRERTFRLRELPHEPRPDAVGPRDLYDRVSHRQARPPTGRRDVRGLSRVPEISG